jgi:hypothetical protein
VLTWVLVVLTFFMAVAAAYDLHLLTPYTVGQPERAIE